MKQWATLFVGLLLVLALVWNVDVEAVRDFGTIPSDESGWPDGAPTSSGSSTVIVRKPADESITTDIVLSDDDTLTFAIGASETWIVTFNLFVTAASVTPDINFDINVPSGATGNYGMSEIPALSGNGPEIGTTSASVPIDTSPGHIRISALIVNSTNAGNVTLQWRQTTSSADALTVKDNSYLIAHQVL